MLESLEIDLQKALLLCQNTELLVEAQAFMINKEKNLLRRIGSISSGLEWTQGQKEVMEDYQQGRLALSDDSCPSRFGDEKINDDFSDQFEGE